jgi:hypothetical protein
MSASIAAPVAPMRGRSAIGTSDMSKASSPSRTAARPSATEPASVGLAT